jgi:hypothetical protein
MTPIEPTTPISITLQAQEWNNVIAVLNDGPHRIVRQLIDKISEQAQAAAGQTGTQPLANGAASHVSN